MPQLAGVRLHRHKFSAQKAELDGIKFDSKKEAKYYSELKLRIRAGEVIFFIRQAPFDIPGNMRHRVDFQEFHSDGTVHFVEVKGYDTKEGIKVRKQVEALYPIKIEVV